MLEVLQESGMLWLPQAMAAEGQIKPKADWRVFWEKLCRTNLLTVLSDL